jgi:hypothetical protein
MRARAHCPSHHRISSTTIISTRRSRAQLASNNSITRARSRPVAAMATPAAGGGGGNGGNGEDATTQPPAYAPPLAADARVVVKDASLGVSARVLGERLAHRRYLATFDRLVRFTRPGPAPGAASAPENNAEASEKEHHHDVAYDVIGHPRCEFRFAVVFPYHPATNDDDDDDEGEVTLVREYAHGPHRFVFTLPSGQFERQKHGDGGLLATARAELEEEAHLEGGTWHRLLPEGHPGIPEVKWCANAFEPFLCVGPSAHPAPAARDGEEEAAGIEAVRVPLRAFRRLAASGEMLLPSVATGWMAIEKLRELGLVKKG